MEYRDNGQREYRFVIVGGGSAGCLLASLLAERQDEPVALIEAGGFTKDVRTVVPNWYPRLFRIAVDWNYATVPQLGLASRSIAWPRGKVVGGTGAINALIYLQAAEADLARWGWKTLSTTSAPTTRATFLDLAPVQEPHPWSDAFLASAEQAGLRRIAPWNLSTSNSCGLYSLTQRNGQRTHTGELVDSTDTRYKNLTVITGCNVEQIRIRDGRAYGILAKSAAGEKLEIRATDEVVISAGAIGSPQLLTSSGIGGSEQLARLKIPVHVDLPAVGRNLQDHLAFPVIFRTNRTDGLARRHSLASRNQYRQTGTGALASNIAEAGALFQTSGANGDASDCQIHFTPTHYLKYPRTNTEDRFLSLVVTDLHPLSRGEIQFSNDANGRLQPEINPNYFGEPADIPRMLDAVHWARGLASQGSLSDLIDSEVMPGQRRTSKDAVEKSLRKFAQTLFHPIGTCRMESDESSGPYETVVNKEGRVHGVSGLSVCDASVFPDLPSANTNAVTLLYAARFATMRI